jgi:riboflavin kinase/FMN adenylyltransferase
MRVIRHVADAERAVRPRVVAAGEFDGVHRGHQLLLARVVERARAAQGESVAIVARHGAGAPRLLDRRAQLEQLRGVGLDLVVFAPAGRIAGALDRLGAVACMSAPGGAARAPAGGRLEEIAPLTVRGLPICARAIRAAVARGDLAAAGALLGRPPSVGGRVVHGFHRGAALGIPTANLRVRDLQLPPDGVYAVRARVGDARLRGVANIGFNPTFGNRTRTVETHLLDFSGDLYRQRLDIALLARLRDERKFPDVPTLLVQIRTDIAAARRWFEAHDR